MRGDIAKRRKKRAKANRPVIGMRRKRSAPRNSTSNMVAAAGMDAAAWLIRREAESSGTLTEKTGARLFERATELRAVVERAWRDEVVRVKGSANG